MPALTIGAYKLPAAEVILIKTLIRLFGHSPDFKWRFADTGPFDAVLIATPDHHHAPATIRALRRGLWRRFFCRHLQEIFGGFYRFHC